jgi:hypothetical protein
MTGKELKSYCRRCGGSRHHETLSEHAFPWSESDAPIEGNDTWSVIQCAGCRTVSFCHTHWFSEDYEATEDGGYRVIEHRDLYPPAPPRRMPEWGADLFHALTMQQQWVRGLHSDIYAALGMKAYSLAAMGIRTLVDFVVTSKAGDYGTFSDKLARLRQRGLTEAQEKITDAAFDAGSAAAHRGHIPTMKEAYLMLDIAEKLFEQFYIEPSLEGQRKKDADRLRANTPPRVKPPKKE